MSSRVRATKRPAGTPVVSAPGEPMPTRPTREVARDIYALVGKRKAKKLEKLLKELARALVDTVEYEEQE